MRYEGPRSPRRGHPDTATDALARGLGWFSIGLGLVELLAPKALARGLGMRGQEGLVQAYGAREVATGIGILTSDDPTPWIWGRVAGDALDLATLAAAYEGNPKKDNLLLAAAAVAGVTALDAVCADRLMRSTAVPLPPIGNYRARTGYPKGIRVSRGVAKNVEGSRGMMTPDALKPWAA
ncbi:MAG: cyclase dehydrase [Methylobacterium sp.]|uniref:cyclase dehydrase n=1 Tax=Methylobacterium sp. TaxID=409 RepID=UPI0025D4506F|nr:cyclase dehydrase [Methylobacterium sp.]MBX9931766.1 cyclase dehydrase [Methylobacterium sp.]